MAQASKDPVAPTPSDLYAAFTRMFRAVKRMNTGSPVDGPTLGVMMEIHSRGPVRLSDVASCVGLDASTVSRHVTGLERDGHVRREPDPADGRASRLALSDAGRALLEESIERRRALLGAAVDHWPQRDRQTLHRLLERLAADIERVTPVPTSSRQEQSA